MSPRQTKTVLNPEQLAALGRGVDHFNRGRFFEAHEDWEIRWRKLPLPDRPAVQAAILVCGVFVLLGKRRTAPALRLARLAIERFADAEAAARLHGASPALRLLGAEEKMLRLLARIRLGESDPALLLSEAEGLRAEMHGTD